MSAAGIVDQAAAASSWTGLTIKDILDRVDLFNVTIEGDGAAKKASQPQPSGFEDIALLKSNLKSCLEGTEIGKMAQQAMAAEEQKSAKTGMVLDATDPSSAFLGPKLWDNHIQVPNSDGNALNGNPTAAAVIAAASANADYSVMDLEDFLLENDLDMDGEKAAAKESSAKAEPSRHEQVIVESAEPEDEDCPPRKKPRDGRSERNILPKADNDFLYAESKRAKAEREKAERRRRRQLEIEERHMMEQATAEETDVQFAPEDLALATIPGMDFDPRKRAFSVDELKPQPIIKKRKKNYVDSNEKDGKYWAKREKNNVAARRSREARRLKENQIALRAAFLEKENSALRGRLREAKASRDAAARECAAIKEQLMRYETMN